MILLITCSYDLTIEYIEKKYREIYDFFRFNIDKIEEFSIVI